VLARTVVGAAIAIGAMEWFSFESHYPLVIIPFATSIVLVVGSPQAEPAQPRALIGGHVVATLVGLAVLHLTGPHAWASAAAVGVGRVCHVCHRHVSPTGRDQSPAGGLTRAGIYFA
jgi:CBS-domain-containing membrane protein